MILPPSTTLHIRLAEPEDAPTLVTLVNGVYRGANSRIGWTTEADLLDGQRTDLAALEAFLARPRHDALMLVGECENRPVACLQLERQTTVAHLGMLSVEAPRQNQGWGRHMLIAAETHAREVWRCSLLTLSVIHLRHELIAWYQRRGFVLTTEREEFPYGDPRFGLPRRDDLWFVTFIKDLTTS